MSARQSLIYVGLFVLVIVIGATLRFGVSADEPTTTTRFSDSPQLAYLPTLDQVQVLPSLTDNQALFATNFDAYRVRQILLTNAQGPVSDQIYPYVLSVEALAKLDQLTARQEPEKLAETAPNNTIIGSLPVKLVQSGLPAEVTLAALYQRLRQPGDANQYLIKGRLAKIQDAPTASAGSYYRPTTSVFLVEDFDLNYPLGPQLANGPLPMISDDSDLGGSSANTRELGHALAGVLHRDSRSPSGLTIKLIGTSTLPAIVVENGIPTEARSTLANNYQGLINVAYWYDLRSRVTISGTEYAVVVPKTPTQAAEKRYSVRTAAVWQQSSPKLASSTARYRFVDNQTGLIIAAEADEKTQLSTPVLSDNLDPNACQATGLQSNPELTLQSFCQYRFDLVYRSADQVYYLDKLQRVDSVPDFLGATNPKTSQYRSQFTTVTADFTRFPCGKICNQSTQFEPAVSAGAPGTPRIFYQRKANTSDWPESEQNLAEFKDDFDNTYVRNGSTQVLNYCLQSAIVQSLNYSTIDPAKQATLTIRTLIDRPTKGVNDPKFAQYYRQIITDLSVAGSRSLVENCQNIRLDIEYDRPYDSTGEDDQLVTPSPVYSPIPTTTPTVTPTTTPVPTSTPTPIPTPTATATASATPKASPSPTATPAVICHDLRCRTTPTPSASSKPNPVVSSLPAPVTPTPTISTSPTDDSGQFRITDPTPTSKVLPVNQATRQEGKPNSVRNIFRQIQAGFFSLFSQR
ncbi:MAG: polymorphic outer membrane protein [Candidatus Berkelbacteria bacterium Gr01-1014_85]|uniref:Polymorphic outer membrane protein n=1 Tax=Candidatus Berkelbacteria bacterium Gr01-1014_85 TaxID=2017150 RepID=A0A554JE05_9BACT|nr:MAG: polymorphic outer membrane protein [Candidatus Berkelbacteria bacterium Gr01-1014_85]